MAAEPKFRIKRLSNGGFVVQRKRFGFLWFRDGYYDARIEGQTKLTYFYGEYETYRGAVLGVAARLDLARGESLPVKVYYPPFPETED